MDTTAGNFSKQGQALADSATDKAQHGIRSAQRVVGTISEGLSDKVENLRSDAAPLIRTATKQARSIGRTGYDAMGDAAQRASEAVSDASDAIVSYTKENPVKALALAAVAGALVYGLVTVINSARD